jgi:hypothetical protein
VSAHERERLSAWLDGELTPAEQVEVEAHLSTCAECRARLADMGAVDEKARGLPLEPPAGYFETFPGRLRARIEARGRVSARPARAGWRPPVWTWAAAAALILAVVTPLTMMRGAGDRAPIAFEPRAPAALEETQVASEATGPPAPATTVEAPAPGLEEKDASARDDEALAAPKSETARPQMPRAPRALAKGQAPREELDAPTEPTAPAEGAPAAAPPAPEPELTEEAREVTNFAAAPPSEEEAQAASAGVEALGRQAATADVAGPEAEGARRRAAPRTQAAGRASTAMRAPVEAPADEVQEAPRRGSDESLREDGQAFARLAREPTPRDADGWRGRRDAWRAFVATHPGSPRADEARVRAIEAGLEAWRAGGERADLDRARADARAYLARDDAQQAERVRRDLESVEGR